MDYFSYAKEAYFDELTRRDEIRRALNIPMALGIVIGGAIFSLLTSYIWPSFSCAANLLFGVSAILASIALSVAIFFLVRTYVSYEYAMVPTAKEILDYREEMKEYLEESNGDLNILDDEVQIYLTQQYAEKCAS